MKNTDVVLSASCVSKAFKIRRHRIEAYGWVKDIFSPQYTIAKALNGVNLKLSKGECLGFLGPNGAGKSTLIKILCGIQTPDSGEVVVLGHRPQSRKNAFYRQLGVVFGHKNSLWWDLPLRRSFEMARLLYEIPDSLYHEKLRTLCELLNLTALLERPVRVFSLGERVKSELAMNLLSSPKILFLDEPTIGLDITSKYEIRHLLNNLRTRYGLSIFLTSHDIGDIEGCCQRVVLADKGVVHFDGTLSELKKVYQDTLSVTITDVVDYMPETIALLKKRIGKINLPNDLWSIHSDGTNIKVNCPKSSRSKILNIVISAIDRNFLVSEPSLEDILLKQFKVFRDIK